MDTRELPANRGIRWPVFGQGSLVLSSLAGSWYLVHRRSGIVKNWKRSSHAMAQFGPLNARVFGQGSHTTLLLHGLGATSNYWPATYDVLAEAGRVVVPDLLGFGGSLDMARSSFTLDEHLDALDACLTQAAPETKRLTIVAHSMGAGLGVAYAGRSSVPIAKLVCVGAPIFAGRQNALEMIGDEGFMARLLLLNQTWAKRFCALNCAHRTLAGLLAAAMTPRFPIEVSRQASLHTWSAYHDSLENLVLDFDWQRHIEALGEMPLELIWGSEDQIGDPDLARLLIQRFGRPSSASVQTVPHHGHHLAITHADLILSSVSTPPN